MRHRFIQGRKHKVRVNKHFKAAENILMSLRACISYSQAAERAKKHGARLLIMQNSAADNPQFKQISPNLKKKKKQNPQIWDALENLESQISDYLNPLSLHK